VLDGIQAEMSRSGVDIGEAVEAPAEEISEVPEEPVPAVAAEEQPGA
jgi:hypothetical protein